MNREEESCSTTVALILVHNHRHEANIPRLEDLLSTKFGKIWHVVPFYRGANDSVISVSGSSHHFPGFFAQAYKQLSQIDCTHYVFCGDDLILNPRLNSLNLASELGLGGRSGFIKYLRSFTESSFAWPHVAAALSALASNSGTNWKNELPDIKEACALLQRHNLLMGELSLSQCKQGIRPKQVVQLLNYLIMRCLAGARTWGAIKQPPYPLVGGYSDFIVVPSCALADFCHYCGVFSAADVFAELAAPTALALSCEHIVREADTSWEGLELWGKDIEAFGLSRNHSLEELFRRFLPNQLYVHPVKLSKWS
jgi:hypothetical protein